MASAIPGVIIGLLGSLVFTRIMRGLLFGVSPIDPLTFVAIPVAARLGSHYWRATPRPSVQPAWTQQRMNEIKTSGRNVTKLCSKFVAIEVVGCYK
jgi:hypothetical protein